MVFIQNKSQNNREYIFLRPPQGVKYLYFDPKIPKILAFLLITSQFEPFGWTKQPQNTLEMKRNSVSLKLVTNSWWCCCISTPRGSNLPILTKKMAQIFEFF